MKITQIETFYVKPRWMFLKLSTDEGITGWGEPTLEGRIRTVDTAIQELGPLLIDQDPTQVEPLWQTMYRTSFYRGGPILTSAISGVEQALWDIKGKAAGLPVCEMLGGRCRERIRMCAHCGGLTPEESVSRAKGLRLKGYTAMKTAVEGPVHMIETAEQVARIAQRIAAIREEVGPGVDLAVDFHGRVNPAMADRLIRAIEPSQPMFVEEPCFAENVDALARIAALSVVPIATGERLYTRWGFREVLEKQAAAILRPDLSHAGGIFEGRKIAAMAETYYAMIAPHCPQGPIALAACLQLDACIPNFLIQEHVGLQHRHDLGLGFLKEPFTVREGYIKLPSGPGLGIEVDEEALKDRVFDGDWDTPILRNRDDGSLANR